MVSFESFVAMALEGNIQAIRESVVGGFDPNSQDDLGESALEVVIRGLEFHPAVKKYELVAELLALGATPESRNSDGSGPLFGAALNMDARMLEMLMDAGADPNAEKMDSNVESLLDWAEFDYRYEIWDLGNFPSSPDRKTGRISTPGWDSWTGSRCGQDGGVQTICCFFDAEAR